MFSNVNFPASSLIGIPVLAFHNKNPDLDNTGTETLQDIFILHNNIRIQVYTYEGIERIKSILQNPFVQQNSV